MQNDTTHNKTTNGNGYSSEAESNNEIIMAEVKKALTHVEAMRAFKENVIALSQNVAFAKMHNLDAKKLKSECLFVIDSLESFTGEHGESNQKKFIGATFESLQICLIKVVLNKHFTLNKKLGMCYLIPRSGIFTLMPGYPVLIAAARKHGVSIGVQTVRKNDTYSNEIVDGQSVFKYKQEMFGTSEIVGYVAYSKDLDGFTKVVAFTLSDIEKRKKKAESKAIWAAWEEEQSQKTVILRLCSMYFRQYLMDLMDDGFDIIAEDVEFEEMPENGKNTLTEPKKYFTAEESSVMSKSVQSAPTRELALKALSDMDIAHEKEGFIFLPDQRAMFVAFIDKKYPRPMEIAETPSVFVSGGKYEPTEFDLAGLSACKNVGQFDLLADSIGRNLIETYGNDAFILESFTAWAETQRKNFK